MSSADLSRRDNPSPHDFQLVYNSQASVADFARERGKYLSTKFCPRKLSMHAVLGRGAYLFLAGLVEGGGGGVLLYF